METIMGIVMGIIFFLIILCTGGWMFYMGVRMLFAEKIPKLGLSVREYTKQAEAVITKQEIRRGHHYAFRYIEYRYTVNGNEKKEEWRM